MTGGFKTLNFAWVNKISVIVVLGVLFVNSLIATTKECMFMQFMKTSAYK